MNIAVVIWHSKKDYFSTGYNRLIIFQKSVLVALATLTLNPCATRLAANKQTEASNG